MSMERPNIGLFAYTRPNSACFSRSHLKKCEHERHTFTANLRCLERPIFGLCHNPRKEYEPAVFSPQDAQEGSVFHPQYASSGYSTGRWAFSGQGDSQVQTNA